MLFKKYSYKLNGYWEEGYHYYVEIKDKSLTLRDASKRIVFETSLKYDIKKLEKGEKTDLIIGNTTLAADYKGNPMWWITGFYYENGEIYMKTHYTIMGDSDYVLKKVEHDPFYNYLILDDEYLPRLQGEWVQWRRDKNTKSTLVIKGNDLRFLYDGSEIHKCRIHAVAYRSDPKKVFLNDFDLTVSGVGMYTSLDVEPDMLTGYEMVCDMSMPLSVFARRDMLDKIAIPPAALVQPKNTMIYEPETVDVVDKPKSTFTGMKKTSEENIENGENNDQD